MACCPGGVGVIIARFDMTGKFSGSARKMVLSNIPLQIKGLSMDIHAEFMSAIINAFEANKRLADRAVEQVPDDKLQIALDANTNSISIIMKHVAGNLLSRWTDFLTTDGE